MQPQISLWFDDIIRPNNENILVSDILIDRGSRYWYAFAFADSKESIRNFLEFVRKNKPFDTANHCSYAFRIRSPEWILVEWKWDDWETWAGQCILRELKRRNIEQIILVVSRHFGWIYLQRDRYKNIVDVARLAIEELPPKK